jgi:hypothetical protein
LGLGGQTVPAGVLAGLNQEEVSGTWAARDATTAGHR